MFCPHWRSFYCCFSYPIVETYLLGIDKLYPELSYVLVLSPSFAGFTLMILVIPRFFPRIISTSSQRFGSQEPFGAGLGLWQRGARDGAGDAKIHPGPMGPMRPGVIVGINGLVGLF